MDFEQVKERLAPFLKQYKIPLIIGFVGLAFIVFGLISANLNNNQKTDDLTKTVDKSESEEKKITVDVEGAVTNPGVYKLKQDARIQDALIAAGGMSGDADREKVAKSINLASKILDGGKIYIPTVGEISINQDSSSQDVAGESISGLINVNTATESELDSLYGIGAVTAAKIIDNRPYYDIQELVAKKVISQRVFSKIKDKITAN